MASPARRVKGPVEATKHARFEGACREATNPRAVPVAEGVKRKTIRTRPGHPRASDPQPETEVFGRGSALTNVIRVGPVAEPGTTRLVSEGTAKRVGVDGESLHDASTSRAKATHPSALMQDLLHEDSTPLPAVDGTDQRGYPPAVSSEEPSR
jgi:hypothetical protein